MNTATEIEAKTQQARVGALARIQAIMQPGAEALQRTRVRSSPYEISRRVQHAHGGLAWCAYGRSSSSGLNPRTRVYIREDNRSPEQLADLAHHAAIETARIVRECEQEIASYAAEQSILQAAYDTVAR